MIIDFHTHIFPTKIAGITIEKLHNNSGNPPFSDGTEDGLNKALNKANADLAVSLPVLTKPTQFDSVVRFALEINSKYEKTIFGIMKLIVMKINISSTSLHKNVIITL